MTNAQTWNQIRQSFVNSIISVQLMTSPIGCLKWYKERYKPRDNAEQLKLFSNSWYDPQDGHKKK